LVIFGEYIFTLHGLGNGNPGSGERNGRHVDVLDQIVSDLAFPDSRTTDDKRDVRAFVVKKLLATRVADAVVGHENDQCLIEDAFLLQAGDDLADVLVGEAHGIEIRRPIVQQHGIARIVRRQLDLGGVGGFTKLGFGAFGQLLGAIRIAAAKFAAGELDLHEKRLVRFSPGPIA
jgi:hypothetical protein